MRIEKIYELTLDDPSMSWRDDPDLADLGLVSTSALMELIHSISRELIPTSPEMTTVVVSSNVRHLSPIRLGERVRLHILIFEGDDSKYIVRAEVFNQQEKVFENDTIMFVVRKDEIRRAALAQAAEA